MLLLCQTKFINYFVAGVLFVVCDVFEFGTTALNSTFETIAVPSSETQGFNGDGTERERLRAGKRWGEGRGRERGKGKPWEASLYRSFLDQLLF